MGNLETKGSKRIREYEDDIGYPWHAAVPAVCVASEVARAPTSQEMLVEKLICHYSACKAELLRFADVMERIHAPPALHAARMLGDF